MSIYDDYISSIPEYRKTLYLEGFSPYQILQAAHQRIIDAADDDDDDGYQIIITSEVKKK